MTDGQTRESDLLSRTGRHNRAANFGSAPRLYGSDRKFFSNKNVTACERSGVEVVCIPQRGGKKTAAREADQKSREFKKNQRFRAGIEGRLYPSSGDFGALRRDGPS
jgi:IS5 family transposase